MKTLQKIFMLLALFVVPVISYGQQNFTYSDPIGSMYVRDVATVDNYTVYAGANQDTDVHDQIMVNGTIYDSVLLSTLPNSNSLVDIVEIVGNTLILAGRPNLIPGGDNQAIVILYDLPNLNLIGYVKFGGLAVAGKVYSVLKDSNDLYFSVRGVQPNSYYQSSFGSTPGPNVTLLGTEDIGVFKFNITSNSLSKQLYRPSGDAFMPKSLVKKGNYLYQVRIPEYQQWILEKYDTDLNLVSISSQAYGELDTTIYSKMLVDTENGQDYVYVYVKDATDPNNRKGLRKFNTSTMTEVPEFKEGTGASVLASTQAKMMLSINNNRIAMLSDDNMDGGIFIYDKTSGDIMSYKKFELKRTNGTSYNGVQNLAMKYNNSSNLLSVAGIVASDATTNLNFYGTTIPENGFRPMSYDYTPEINPASDMTMTVDGYPSATITRVGNRFTVSGIPQSAWGALTINAGFVDPGSTFIFAPKGGSWTMNFNDSIEDCFASANSSGNQYTLWDATYFMITMTSSAGVDEFELEKKLYPNPTTGTVNIPEMYRNYNIEVYDLHGRKLQEITGGTSSVSLDNVPVGIYLVKIIDTETQHVGIQKIVKK